MDRDQMDEHMISKWNEYVSPKDEIWHMGDFAFRGPGATAKIVERLNGSKHLILGNHDSRMKSSVRKMFASVHSLHEINVEKQKIVLCHFPMLTWNKSHRGAWMLHGHCHGNLPDDPNALRIDVGVDCHKFRPISFDEIKELMKTKSFLPIDHHGE